MSPIEAALLRKAKNPQSPSSHTKASSPFSITNKMTVNGSAEAIKVPRNNFCYIPMKDQIVEENKNKCEGDANKEMESAIAEEF